MLEFDQDAVDTRRIREEYRIDMGNLMHCLGLESCSMGMMDVQ